jgi:hypothetical protein
MRVDVYREFVAFEIRQRAGRAPARVVPATDERALRLLRVATTRARAGRASADRETDDGCTERGHHGVSNDL